MGKHMELAVRKGKAVRTARGMATMAALAGAAFCHAAKPVKAKQAIRHVVVIFQENVSFDHYFGTYPIAANLPGEPEFHALPGTPKIDGFTDELLRKNPNSLNELNGPGRSNPFRLDRSQPATSDQSHSYTPEQKAFNHGKMDLFPLAVGHPDGPNVPGEKRGAMITKGLTMGYYDGNTVTAYWNYAQHFAMSDRHFDVMFGPSTPGAINLISGTTNGAVNDQNAEGSLAADGNGGFTLISSVDPVGDLCSSTTDALVHQTGRNIGDLLSAANISWGWFQGGFDLTAVNENGTTGCRRANTGFFGSLKRDYVPHHEPFQYYKSTQNLKHVRPKSVASIGSNEDGGANHQYDTHDFFDAVKAGNFPAVTYLKAQAFQNGHAGSSTPLDEQRWVVQVINFLQQQQDWEHTVVFIAYDDSDGWYDHAQAKVTNGSASRQDVLDGPGVCGDVATALPGIDPKSMHASGRCGPGPRLPLLVISPWAKANFVDHTQTDQTSILKFIEDIFLDGKRIGQGSFDSRAGSLESMFDFSSGKPKNKEKFLLDPATGLMKPGE